MKIITETKELNLFVKQLGDVEYVTIDTEFIREKTYWPKLCLIQIAAPQGPSALIDPLSPQLDPSELYHFLLETPVLKVFHAARQDVEIFVHLTGKVPSPLFDTQVAAMVCGFGESVGYDTLVQSLTGVSIDKSSRYTDWSKRPLTHKQCQYALSDVTHLRQVYEALKLKLEETGRLPWLQEELQLLHSIDTYVTNPKDAWKKVKAKSLKPRQLAILQEIASVREKEAQHRDLPRNRVLKDEALLEISTHAPADTARLSSIRGLSKNVAESRVGRELLDAISRGSCVPSEELPKIERRKKLTAKQSSLSEILKLLLKIKAEQNNVAPKLIATSAHIEEIVLAKKSMKDILTGWRYGVFGVDAEKLIKGEIGLAFLEGRIEFVPIHQESA